MAFSPKLRLAHATVSEEAIDAAARVLRSGWTGMGEQTQRFEQEFAEYLGAPACVALSSGTMALQLGLRIMALEPGAEVITTPITFVPTNHAILLAGLRPVFADVQPDTGNIDPLSVKSSITEETRAIMVMHYGGYPCDLDELYALAREYKLRLIEDCAHACGSIYKGARVGRFGDLQAFSFGPVKNLSAVQGGALTVRRPSDGAVLRRLRFHGINREESRGIPRPLHDHSYEVVEVGTNGQMNDVCAAIGRVHLAGLDRLNGARAELAAHYRYRLGTVKGIDLTNSSRDRESSYFLFSVFAEDRDHLLNKLEGSSVEAGVYFRRNDRFPMFDKRDLPNAERFINSVLSLPIHPQLHIEDVDYICDLIAGGW